MQNKLLKPITPKSNNEEKEKLIQKGLYHN